jgi:hypothetical protein
MQYEEFRRTNDTFTAGANASKEGYTPTTPALDNPITAIIADRLSTLLWATDGAFTRIARAQKRNANEAERRHDWDELLYKFFVRNDDEVSLDVLYATTVCHIFHPAN